MRTLPIEYELGRALARVGIELDGKQLSTVIKLLMAITAKQLASGGKVTLACLGDLESFSGKINFYPSVTLLHFIEAYTKPSRSLPKVPPKACPLPKPKLEAKDKPIETGIVVEECPT